MADLSQLTLPITSGGTTTDQDFNIKDATARSDISTINGKIPSGASSSNKMATASDVTTLTNGVKANTQLIKDTVGWSGKNKFPMTLDSLKASNPRGTWNGNVYTDTTGVTFTVETESGYVTAVKANGSASGNVSCFYIKNANFDGKYIVNGCPSGGVWDGTQTYRVRIGKYDGTFLNTDLGNGVEVTFPSGSGAEIQLNTGVGYTCNNLTFKIMARDVNILDSTFEPYHGSTAVDWSSYAKTGVHNLNGSVYLSKSLNNVTFTANSDNTVAVVANNALGDTTSSQRSFTAPITAQCKYMGGISNDAHCFVWDLTTDTRPYSDSSKTTLVTSNSNGRTDAVEFYMEKGHKYGLVLRVNNGKSVSGTFYPMILLVEDNDTTYQPYTMTSHILTENVLELVDEVGHAGKNLLSLDLLKKLGSSYEWNGITYEIRSDGGVRVYGTATAVSAVNLGYVDLTNNYFILSGAPSGLPSDCYLRAHGPSATTYATQYLDTGSSVEFYSGSGTVRLWIDIRVPNGATIDKIFYPMVRYADIEDDTFYPYKVTVNDVDRDKLSYADNAKTGVHNFLPDNIKTETIGTLSITDNKGELTINGSTSSDVDRYYIGTGTTGWEYTNMPTGDYTIACDNTDKLPDGYRFIVAEEGTGTIASVYSAYPSQNFHLDTTKRYRIFMRFASGSYSNVKLHPIVKLQSDTDTSWTPNAMTNQQLTDFKIPLGGVLYSTNNLDDVKQVGLYGIDSAPINSPESVSYCTMMVLPMRKTLNPNGDTAVVQVVIKDSIYVRRYTGTPLAWTAWKKYTGTSL